MTIQTETDQTGVVQSSGSGAPTCLAEARRLVGPELARIVERLDDANQIVVRYHLGWTDADGAVADGVEGGKALRPALALLSARVAGAPAAVAVTAAAAVELVHNFSLLHDDLMDGDTQRRHRPTAWTVFGRAAAVLAGDGLLALAAEVLLEDPSAAAATATRSLLAATGQLVAGQSADLQFEDRMDVSLAECLQMAAGKTGALLACSASIGAQLAQADPYVVARLGAFGAEVGLAFQFVDDLLGLWGDPATTGKPVLADLRCRKKSLPIVHALTSDTAAGKRLDGLYSQPEPLTEDQLHEAAAAVEDAGSRAWAEAECDRLLAEALRHLESIGQPGSAVDELAGLAAFVVRRNS
ncbi:MAG: polyprenyl synthetase family protein [Pseudonocardia sp.]|nr:polyprenyl synthetase family protein [Pseudonocardia sp.]